MNENLKDLVDSATDDIVGVKVLDKKRFAEVLITACHDMMIVGGVDDLTVVLNHFGIE